MLPGRHARSPSKDRPASTEAKQMAAQGICGAHISFDMSGQENVAARDKSTSFHGVTGLCRHIMIKRFPATAAPDPWVETEQIVCRRYRPFESRDASSRHLLRHSDEWWRLENAQAKPGWLEGPRLTAAASLRACDEEHGAKWFARQLRCLPPPPATARRTMCVAPKRVSRVSCVPTKSGRGIIRLDPSLVHQRS